MVVFDLTLIFETIEPVELVMLELEGLVEEFGIIARGSGKGSGSPC
jgi:hypothetical protein